jgi:hypothetical protein
MACHPILAKGLRALQSGISGAVILDDTDTVQQSLLLSMGTPAGLPA